MAVIETIPTRDQLSVFLKEKWYERNCEMCGTSSWNLAGSEDWPNSAFMAVNGENKTPGPFWPVSLLVCGNCQNTKSIFLLGVLAWLNSEEGQACLGQVSGNLWDGAPKNE